MRELLAAEEELGKIQELMLQVGRCPAVFFDAAGAVDSFALTLTGPALAFDTLFSIILSSSPAVRRPARTHASTVRARAPLVRFGLPAGA